MNKRKSKVQLWAEREEGLLDKVTSKQFWNGIYTAAILIAAAFIITMVIMTSWTIPENNTEYENGTSETEQNISL